MSEVNPDLVGLDDVKIAIAENDAAALESLLMRGHVGSRVPMMALPRAIEKEAPILVGLLIDLGSLDPNHHDEGLTAVGYAIENGSPEVVAKLCGMGADPDLAVDPRTGRRPLQLAVEIESIDFLDDAKGGYPTSYTEVLLKAGADPLLPDRYGANAIDEARGSRHKNALVLMEQVVTDQSSPAASNDYARELLDPVAVVIISSERSEDGKSLAMSVDENDQVVLKSLGSTEGEVWILHPSPVSSVGKKCVCFSLVSCSSGKLLEQPNPANDFLQGDAPLLKVTSSTPSKSSQRFLWTMCRLDSDSAEELWSIRNYHQSYAVAVAGGAVAEGALLCLWAWSGKRHQRWIVQERRKDEVPIARSTPKNQRGFWGRLFSG